MNKKTINQIKKHLLQQKSDILQNIKASFEVDASGDETDQIQAIQLTALNHQLTSREKNKLVMVNMALEKIANQTFGLCVGCGEDIDDKRLLANPCCIKCISCAEKSEILARRR